MKRLVIAEKPSVGRDLARALGLRATDGRHGLFEDDELIVTWCVGHLVELAEPHEYRPEWKHWSARLLPVLPDELKTRPVRRTADQWKVVAAALRRRDVEEVVNACDAGREGELIFRMAYELAGCRKPVLRLWISSLTPDAIRQGFRKLRPGSELDDLAAAARCRAQADWLVGINATRAATVMGRGAGPDSPLLSVGRVQTPTLAILAEREEAIETFVPEDYFELWADFHRPGESWSAGPDAVGFVNYRGRWRGPDGETRFPALEQAQAVAASVQGKSGVVESLESKTVEEKSPALFDLTSLQRTANRALGLSAARTLSVAQALYERHKLITYPRTDSRYLTPDLVPTLRGRIEALQHEGPWAGWAVKLLERPDLPSIARFVRPGKVKDHHAILPTSRAPDLAALSAEERRIHELVVRRFLAAFYPAARFLDVEAITRVDTPQAPEPCQRFRSHGRSLLEAGWRDVAGFDEKKPSRRRKDEAAEEAAPEPGAELLARLAEGSDVRLLETGIDEKRTKPPPRYNDATLLSAMEGAGKLVEEDELREAMKDGGLGTPATRASIIETLLERRYVEREDKSLRVTEGGRSLLRSLPVAELKSPELTGRWEARLARIASGGEAPERFMSDIRCFVVEATHRILAAQPPPVTRRAVGRCPRCGAEVTASRQAFECAAAREGACTLRIPVFVAGKTLDETLVRQLLEKGRTRQLRGFRSKAGKPFSAALVLEAGGVQLDFDERRSEPAAGPRAERKPRRPRRSAADAAPGRERRPRASAPALSRAARPAAVPTLAALGVDCPACRAGQLVAGRRGWGCSRWREGCPFVLWFEHEGKRLSEAQARDLVAKGRTRLISGFVDERGEAYKARLVLRPGADAPTLERAL
jgi:DNA topoisomerase III